MANVKPSVDYVKDVYQYCIETTELLNLNDKQILKVVNEELANEGYITFPSIKALKSYIRVH